MYREHWAGADSVIITTEIDFDIDLIGKKKKESGKKKERKKN